MRNYRRFGRFLAATTVTATVLAGTPSVFAQTNTVEFSVSNITDFHGHLVSGVGDPAAEDDEMGAAVLASLIKKVNEGQEYAMTTSGDNVGGSAFVSAISEDKYTLDALNAMGVTASAVGNHEFDKGQDDLLGRINDSIDFPYLGANVMKDGKPLLDASFVTELDGVKVGFVGTVTPNTANKVSPEGIQGITFTDAVEATNAEAERLKTSGEADVVIALAHEDAASIAEGLNEYVDAFFGGDSHQRASGVVKREGAADLVWAQGLEYGKVLNDMDITYDKDAGKVVNIELTQYDATDLAELGVTPDPEVEQLVAEAQAEAEELGQEPVGTLPQALYRGSNEGSGSGSNRGVESTLNSYIAEAGRAALSDFLDQDIDLGIMNAGGVRNDFAEGQVTFQNVFDVQPFGNSIVVGTLTGQDILDALEDQWQEPGGDHPRLALGLSEGFTYTYRADGEDGERVISATLNGEKLDPAKEYTVAASTFLFAGGDDFESLKNVKDVNDVGYMDVQALSDYIAAGEGKVPTDQNDVSVSVDGELAAGETVTFNLQSLNYSTEGEPMATEATVAVGSASGSDDIDNAAEEGDFGFNERGRASVELTLPEDFTIDTPIEITTDQGTDVSFTAAELGVTETPDDADNPDDPNDTPNDGGNSSNALSSAGAGFAAIAAIIAGIIGAIGLNPQILPAEVRNIVEDLKAQFESATGLKL